jgi:ribosome-binding protein aMBF1 (putative translation factor)
MTGRPFWRVQATWRRARRETLGLSREVLAARLGVTSRRLAFMESLIYKPSEKLARAWEAALYQEVD